MAQTITGQLCILTIAVARKTQTSAGSYKHTAVCAKSFSLMGGILNSHNLAEQTLEERKPTCSPSLGDLVVWLQEKPNLSLPSISFLMRVPLPTPDGPHITRDAGVCLSVAV